MSTTFFIVCVLIMFLWGMVKLREIREKAALELPPNDEITLFLGLYYSLVRGCINHYHDHKAYPKAIMGEPGGLVEKGYMQSDDLTKKVSVIPLFSIVTTDKGGTGICLTNISAEMANKILSRAEEAESKLRFVTFEEKVFRELEGRVTEEHVNLTLPVPLEPKPPPTID